MTATLNFELLKAGQQRLNAVLTARRLRTAGRSWAEVEKATGEDASSVCKWCQRVAHIAAPSAADLAEKGRSGRPRKHAFTEEERKVLLAEKLAINRTSTDSSTPEAIRRAAKAGALRPELVAVIQEREAEGRPGITETMLRDVRVNEAAIRSYRSPRNAWLDLIQSPGSLMLTVDEATGEERYYKPGEAYTIDDGSINMGCWLSLERPGDKCWEKFRVIVGRFQFIPVVDHRTHCILGFSYTARPRDSYRAEDLTATMQTIFQEHGMPRRMILEHGVSASNLVRDTLETAGVTPIYVRSPHQKIVERMFDIMWTKLSAQPGQVGRFRGEMEEENRVYGACKRGEKDPRDYFQPLPDVLAAMQEAIQEVNSQWVNSPQYGRWQPAEWFARDSKEMVRRLATEDVWMFSPTITKPLLVRAFCIGTTVSLMPGLSIKFHFEADFLCEFIGARVQLYFNPLAPECEAMVVLAEPFEGKPAGTRLGPARQINRNARFTRRAFGYGADPDIGLAAVRSHNQALRRIVKAVRADDKPAIERHEIRDAGGNVVQVERHTAPSAIPQQLPSRRIEPSEAAATGSFRLQRILADQAELGTGM